MSLDSNEFLRDPRLFIPFWFHEKSLKIAGNLILTKENETRPRSLVFNAMWLDYRARIRHLNSINPDKGTFKGFPEADLDKAFDEFFALQGLIALDEVKAKIRCQVEDLSELESLIAAMTGKCDPVEIAAVAHLLWQVKRKLFNLKVKDHLMVIVRGKQGSGKTEAIKILFSILKPWFKNVSLKELTDDRWKHFFVTTYVAFCDELQHAAFADVDVLKGIITSEEIETRNLGTNTYENIRQNATFVGASNKPLAELIKDSSGMRRFFEILTLDRMDWEQINTIDVPKLWQGINERREIPYIAPYKTQLEIQQAELTAVDPEIEFLNDFGLLVESSNRPRAEFVSNASLYTTYQEWCRRNGEKPRTAINFHRKIKNLGMKEYVERMGQEGIRGYSASVESKTRITSYTVVGMSHHYETETELTKKKGSA